MMGRIAKQTVAVLSIGLAIVAHSTAGEEKNAEALDAVLSLESDPEYGAYLANECLTCHTPDGSNATIPQVHGKEKAYLASALLAYKFEQRENDVMRNIAKLLSNEDIAALVTYLSAE